MEKYKKMRIGEEIFDHVDENDNVIGRDRRSVFHGNPAMIHRVAHVLVFDTAGRLYLQKRSLSKDVQPGKWDTSVGGHVDSGESYEEAGYREMKEELGIEGAALEFLHRYLHRNSFESEYVSTYRCVWNGPVVFDEEEIEDGRFWTMSEIESTDPSLFTPNFLDELSRYKEMKAEV